MKNFIIIFLSLILFSQCSYAVSMPKVKHNKLQEMQTRYFDTTDNIGVLKAAITTLQDSGFIIQDIDFDLGYVRARKTYKAHYVSKKRILGWSTVLAAATAYTVFSYGTTVYTMYAPSKRVMNEMRDKTVVVDANVFVEPYYDGKTKIKFNAVGKILQNADGYSFNKNAPMRVLRVYKSKIYDEFFAQTQNYIFPNEI
jgi:hypothetical protein